MQSALAKLGVLTALLPRALSQTPEVTGNPPGAQYIATLPNQSGLPNGAVVISSSPDGNGVSISVSFSNLPAGGGPFIYQIRVNPVGSNGDCSSTGSTLDPANVGSTMLCDPNAPDKCQAGDLSGKHGVITNGSSFSQSYADKYLSTQPSSPAFVGNGSLVLEFANQTIITCANFVVPGQPSSSAAAQNGSASTMATPPPTTEPSKDVGKDKPNSVAATPTTLATVAQASPV